MGDDSGGAVRQPLSFSTAAAVEPDAVRDRHHAPRTPADRRSGRLVEPEPHRSAGSAWEELDRAFYRIAENPNIGDPWPRRAGVRRLVLARVGFLVLYRVRARAECI